MNIFTGAGPKLLINIYSLHVSLHCRHHQGQTRCPSAEPQEHTTTSCMSYVSICQTGAHHPVHGDLEAGVTQNVAEALRLTFQRHCKVK